METTKLLSVKDRPKDYIIWTCPKCGKTRFNTTINPGSRLGKTLYSCGSGRDTKWLEGKFIIYNEGCLGLTTQMINPKYI